MFEAGQQIGSYLLLEKIGEGAFGEVWKAENPELSTTERFALKLPRQQHLDLTAVKNEIFNWILSGRHKNIVPIIECETFGNQIAIVSEFAPDGSLAELLRAQPNPPLHDTVPICLGILEGLAHLHKRKIIHRDLKPENILLHGKVPRLTDFGISRALTDNSYSQTTSGTMFYMAPEAFDGKRNVQTDIRSVGVIMYRMLGGELPFPQTEYVALIGAIVLREPPQLPARVPEELKRIAASALAKAPANRYSSASGMRDDVLRFWETRLAAYAVETVKDAPAPDVPAEVTKSAEAGTAELSRGPFTQSPDLVPFRSGTKWGFSLPTREIAIPPRFDRCGQYWDGLARVKVGEKWGFVDRSGEFHIEPTYELVADFHEGLAAVKHGAWGFVRKNGTRLILPDYHLVRDFHEERAAVRFDKSWGYISPRGTLKTPMHYIDAKSFSEGLAAVKTESGWGFIRERGSIEIPFNYYEVESFRNGRAAVRRQKFEKWGLLNKNGKLVTPYRYDLADTFGDGLMRVMQNRRFFYIDHDGNEVISTTYEITGRFSNGRARVGAKGRYGYIALNGELIIPLKYEQANDFWGGLALVKLNGKRGYIGTDGTEYFED
jgi:hypothetical protein